jgi:hypothetical protein
VEAASGLNWNVPQDETRQIDQNFAVVEKTSRKNAVRSAACCVERIIAGRHRRLDVQTLLSELLV